MAGSFEIENGVLIGYKDGGVIDDIPSSVKKIDDYAFSSCKTIQVVFIPDSVTTIGDYAFGTCENLHTVVIGNGVTVIGEGAFSRCPNLEKVMLPDGVISIGDRAFIECKGLRSIELPASIEEIGENAFDGCYDLVITAPEGSYAAEYIEKNNLAPLDIEGMLEDVEENFLETECLRFVQEYDEGYALSFRHIVVKKASDSILVIGRDGCEESDKDLSYCKMHETYFSDERDFKLYSLLVNEFNKSCEEFGEVDYGETFVIDEETDTRAFITPTMLAILKEFMEWDYAGVMYDTYGMIYTYALDELKNREDEDDDFDWGDIDLDEDELETVESDEDEFDEDEFDEDEFDEDEFDEDGFEEIDLEEIDLEEESEEEFEEILEDISIYEDEVEEIELEDISIYED